MSMSRLGILGVLGEFMVLSVVKCPDLECVKRNEGKIKGTRPMMCTRKKGWCSIRSGVDDIGHQYEDEGSAAWRTDNGGGRNGIDLRNSTSKGVVWWRRDVVGCVCATAARRGGGSPGEGVSREGGGT